MKDVKSLQCFTTHLKARRKIFSLSNFFVTYHCECVSAKMPLLTPCCAVLRVDVFVFDFVDV